MPNNFVEGWGGTENHSGPEVQQTWVLVYSPVLTGYISGDKVTGVSPSLRMEMKIATIFSTSKDYCENEIMHGTVLCKPDLTNGRCYYFRKSSASL